jgi:5-methylcytosine-specific restriction endonuclease McrA
LRRSATAASQSARSPATSTKLCVIERARGRKVDGIARAMLANAKVRAIPRDGSLLPEYSSDTRYRPQWLGDWLEQQYPVCGQPGCDADFHLQTDHVIALSDGGRTEKDNLWRLCWHHHDLKTNHGWRVIVPPHHWRLVPPDASDAPDAPDDPDPP